MKVSPEVAVEHSGDEEENPNRGGKTASRYYFIYRIGLFLFYLENLDEGEERLHHSSTPIVSFIFYYS